MNTKLFLILLLVMVMASCYTQRLSPAERRRVQSAPADSAMYVLSVFVAEDSLFLRRQSRPLKNPSDRRVQHLTERMLATVMHPDSRGVGIAAPQVGIGRDIIWVQRFDKEGEPFEVYFNPQVLSVSEETIDRDEGCLSIPGLRGPVTRPASIEVAYTNQHGERLVERVEGFTARIFLHEIDHLRGVLYTDFVEPGSL